MPSPPSTAMWRALFADMEIPYCVVVIARSKATKQSILSLCGKMDCFAALAMTERGVLLRRQHRAPDQFALLQIDERFVGFGERHCRHRDRRDLPGADQVEQLLRLPQI